MKHINKFILTESNIAKRSTDITKNSINPNLIQIGTIIVFNNGNGVMRGIVAEICPEDDEWSNVDFKDEYYTYDLSVYVDEENYDYNFTSKDIQTSLPLNLEEYHVSYNEIISIESNSKLDNITKHFKNIQNNKNDVGVLQNLISNKFNSLDIEKVFNGTTFVSREFITNLFKYLNSIKRIKIS